MAKTEKIKIQVPNGERMEGGLVYILDDVELAFSEWMLKKITDLYLEGYSPEEIGDLLLRDPDEVFLALFHQGRKGKVNKALAKRI